MGKQSDRNTKLAVWVPDSWLPLIDGDRGEQIRSVWLRDAIRRKLGRKKMPDEVTMGRPKETRG